ncbi:nuclear transport factor 2 family protein [Paenarthrobacter sp. NPDC089714]|uniref:nuclear transport factor 2 family protein n=1 Tax=Paenarthrobacter sp. NPDC089714 TaxID=3364377 RepID=UPI00381BFFBC
MTLTLQDYEDHRQMFARMQYNMDFGHAEAYAADFAEDGIFEVTGLPEEAKHSGRHEGRDAVIALVEQIYSRNLGHARHWLGNHVYTEKGENHARVTSFILIIRPGEAPQAGVTLTGIYNDLLEKVDGSWVVKHRSVTADPQPQHSALQPTDVLVVRRDDYVAGRS